MSKYYKAEDIIDFLNVYCPKDMWEYQIADIPTIEVSEGIPAQGSGDFDLQAITSTAQEIYTKGYEDGKKSVEVNEDCISRADLIESFLADSECKREEAKACMCSLDLMLELIENAPSVTTEQSSIVGEVHKPDYSYESDLMRKVMK